MVESITLPADLEATALSQFDSLVEQDEILYSQGSWKRVDDSNLTINFLNSPALLKKPILTKSDLSRGKGISRSPFIDPDPNFVLCPVGPNHTLIFNKFCAIRPMFLLHTNEFQPQADDLNHYDIVAVWKLLTNSKEPQMVIFNCGADAGASQGHKHLQMFPLPDERDCVMFPEGMDLSYDTIQSHPTVPFYTFVLALEDDISAAKVLTKYHQLLAATKKASKEYGRETIAYNLVMVRKWMVMIPRTHANSKGKAPTNAVGMMGMVWVSSQEEMGVWLDLGVRKHLIHLGLARE